MEFLLSNEVKKIFQILEENRYKVYLVGGIIRDYFLNRENNDFDMATSATPSEMIDLLKDFQIDETNSDFGTIRIKISGKKDIEITTFREEEYKDESRYPTKISFVDDISIDLNRRDFTMNSLAWNYDGFVDYFHGLEDINNFCIRAIGIPTKKFLEDPLRMLRAIRFSSELNFMIEEETYCAIVENAIYISRLSFESIKNEFIKILLSKYPNYAMKCLFDCKMLEYIFQDFDIYWERIYNQIEEKNCNIMFLMEGLSKLDCRVEVRVAAFLYYLLSCSIDIEKKDTSIVQLSEQIVKKLRFSKRISSHICNIIKYYSVEKYISSKPNIHQLISMAGDDCWRNITGIRTQYFSYLREQDSCYELLYNTGMWIQENRIRSRKELCITGKEMISLGYEGKEIGKILDVLYDDVIEGRVENRRVLLMDKASSMMISIKNETE